MAASVHKKLDEDGGCDIILPDIRSAARKETGIACVTCLTGSRRKEKREVFLLGKEEGQSKEAIRLYHEEMKMVPSMIIEKIIARFSLDRESAEKYVEEVLGAVPA